MAGAEGGLLGFLRWVGGLLLGLPRPVGVLVAVSWAALIWYLSSQTIDEPPRGWPWAFAGNAAHVVLFGLFALWLALALPRDGDAGWPRLTPGRIALLFLAVAVYGAIDEVHQSFTGRTPSFFDWITDTCAAAWVAGTAAHVENGRATRASTAARFTGGLAISLAAAALATWG